MVQAVASMIKELKSLGLSFSDLHNLATVVLYIPQSDIDTLKVRTEASRVQILQRCGKIDVLGGKRKGCSTKIANK